MCPFTNLLKKKKKKKKKKKIPEFRNSFESGWWHSSDQLLFLNGTRLY
ncbi:unnamed protein product [Staurois parvus]|uniref:Uncharacterized protein n=1 Tax=Staurois parvus TaxID=386267 RepID=A0ABN9ABJ9_9NEOB|nr:unnamed protein product [Staurois parvus]